MLENRSTVLWFGGAPLKGGSATVGTFRIDAPDKMASHRFRSPVDKTLSGVWIFIRDVALPQGALLRVSIKDDAGGVPFPTGPVNASNTFSPKVGWQKVTIPSSLGLQRCEIYHVVIQPETPDDFTTNQYVELTSLVSRYPVEYQPEDQSTSEHRSFYDLELSFMFKSPPDPLVTQWKANHYQFQPIFAIQCTDGTRLGQPYDIKDEFLVYGPSLWGQRIRLESDADVNHVTVFVKGLEGGTDHLDAILFDMAGSHFFSTTMVGSPAPLVEA